MNTRAAASLLILVSVIAYLPVFLTAGPEFVYDDHRFVRENPAVHDLGRGVEYFTDPTTVDRADWGGIYRPLRTLDFAIDWAIASPFETAGKVRWFHLRNLLYHVVAVLLAWTLFRRWGASDAASTLGALVIALHPVNVESVAWITSRADVLFSVLFLWALLLHGKSKGMDRSFLGASVLVALSLLAKEAAVVFVGSAVLTDYWFRDNRKAGVTLRRWPQYAVYASLAVAYFLLWKGFHDAASEPWWHLEVRWGGSLLGTILTMARGFVYYLRLIFVPVDMAQDWYLAEVSSPDLLTSACLVGIALLVVFAIVRAFRGGGLAAFAILWFLIAIFPASNLPAPIGIPTAERFLYLPLVGVGLAIGTLLARAWSTGPVARAGTVVLLLCLGAVSAERARVWTDNGILWQEAAARFDSPRSLDWLGRRERDLGLRLRHEARQLVDEDRLSEAIQVEAEAEGAFERAIGFFDREIELWRRVVPDHREPVANPRSHRSICLSELRRHQEGLEEAEAVLIDSPGHYNGLAARAMALYGLGRFREAARDIEASLEKVDAKENRANAAAIYEKIAILYEQAGNRAQAHLALKRAWEHLPDPERNAGVNGALQRMDAEFRSRAGPLSKRVDTHPQDWNAWLDLATAYATYGFYEQAAANFHKLLGSDRPEGGDPVILFPYAYYQWQSLDTEEGYREAIRIYDLILSQQPEHEEARREKARCQDQLRRLENQ